MKKIGIFKGSDLLKDLALQHGTISIGHDDDNVIQLQDSGVSGHHAKIINILNLSYIQDLGSAGGTYVNGKRIDKHTLYDGDSIKIGSHKLVFVSDENKRPVPVPEPIADDNSDETVTISREEFEEYFARHATENQAESSVSTVHAEAASNTVVAAAIKPVAPAQSSQAETATAVLERPQVKKPVPVPQASPVMAHNPVTRPAINESVGEPGIRNSGMQNQPAIKHRTVTTRPQKPGEHAGRPSHVQARINTRKNQAQANTGTHVGASTAEKSLEQMIEQPTLPRWFIAASSIAILCMIVFFMFVL